MFNNVNPFLATQIHAFLAVNFSKFWVFGVFYKQDNEMIPADDDMAKKSKIADLKTSLFFCGLDINTSFGIIKTNWSMVKHYMKYEE